MKDKIEFVLTILGIFAAGLGMVWFVVWTFAAAAMANGVGY